MIFQIIQSIRRNKKREGHKCPYPTKRAQTINICTKGLYHMTSKYSKQVFLGRNREGKEVRKRIYANSVSALNEAERKARNEFEKVRNPSDITFGEYAERWLEVYKGSRSPATIEMYRTKLSLCRDISETPLRLLTRSDYQRLVTQCSDRPNTAGKLALTIEQIVRSAFEDGIIEKPLGRLERPKVKSKTIAPLTDAEMVRIFETELPLRDKLFVRIVGTYGLRPAEAFALNIDSFQGDRLIIDRSVGYDGNKPFIKETKNDKVRILPMSETVRPLLNAYIAQIATFYLFPNEIGELMSKSQSRAYCERICREIGISKIYVLRHTVATKLYYKVSPKMGAYLMGHSENVFLNTYSHLDSAQENLQNIF